VSRDRGILFSVAAISLLAGCAPAPALPPGPTAAEVQSYVAQQNADWWSAMYPDEPRPAVSDVHPVKAQDQNSAVASCMLDAGYPLSDGLALRESPRADDIQRATWVCYQRFPVAVDELIAGGFLSEPQLDYLWAYYEARLVPCLELLGYTVGPIPNRQPFIDLSMGYPSWDPYHHLTPEPTKWSDWENLGASCPPPPFAAYLTPQP
jgi:hypothetical protein